MSMIV